MAKNIVACLDGTWNNAVSTSGTQTNVHELFLSISKKDQIKNYSPGVGAHVGWLGSYFFGGIGKGVFQAARAAWQYISANYQDGVKYTCLGSAEGRTPRATWRE